MLARNLGAEKDDLPSTPQVAVLELLLNDLA